MTKQSKTNHHKRNIIMLWLSIAVLLGIIVGLVILNRQSTETNQPAQEIESQENAQIEEPKEETVTQEETIVEEEDPYTENIQYAQLEIEKQLINTIYKTNTRYDPNNHSIQLRLTDGATNYFLNESVYLTDILNEQAFIKTLSEDIVDLSSDPTLGLYVKQAHPEQEKPMFDYLNGVLRYSYVQDMESTN